MASNADFGALGIELEQRALRDHGADGAFHFALRQIVALGSLRIQCLEHAARGIAAVAGSGDGDVVAAGVDDDAEPAFDQREILSVGTDQRGSRAVVIEVDDDLGFGWDLMSRSNLRLGASEGESDALFGKGSGSHGLLRRRVMDECGEETAARERGECAEQAVRSRLSMVTGSTWPICQVTRTHARAAGRRCGHDLAGIAGRRSNSTSTVLPIIALLKADCWLSINSWSRTNRSSISAADTVSRMSAAGVPGRGEYLNEYAPAYPICMTSARVAANSPSVSPGKPTIKSDEKAISWRALRKRSMTRR